MPATWWQYKSVAVRASVPWRRLLGDRVVHRHVQGVELAMPWRHVLPDMAKQRHYYGQNLVEMAAALDHGPETLQVLDIGSNIGDSAAQIMARTQAKVLCVEGDPYWAGFLRTNLGDDPKAVIVEALLTPEVDDDPNVTHEALRSHGTTRFVRGVDDASSSTALPMLSMRRLREEHPDFDGVRLIKSDTDGFDTVLVPAAASAWAATKPVLFFEYDPKLSKLCGDADPQTLWNRLCELGYERLAVWDNTGDPLGYLPTRDAAPHGARLDPYPKHLGYSFWDVAAVHVDDPIGLAALDALTLEGFSIYGTWRDRSHA